MPNQALSKYENEKDEYNANVGSSAIASIFIFMCIMFRAPVFQSATRFLYSFFPFCCRVCDIRWMEHRNGGEVHVCYGKRSKFSMMNVYCMRTLYTFVINEVLSTAEPTSFNKNASNEKMVEIFFIVFLSFDFIVVVILSFCDTGHVVITHTVHIAILFVAFVVIFCDIRTCPASLLNN